MTLQIGDEHPTSRPRPPKDRSASTTGWAIPGRPVLSPEGFHAGLHDRARLHGKLKPEFDKRNVKVIGLSVDPVDNHARWANDIQETQGHAPNYPMIGDPTSRSRSSTACCRPTPDGTSEGRTRRRQPDRPQRLRHRPGQEDQADHRLSDDDRPQFRRGACASSIRCS